MEETFCAKIYRSMEAYSYQALDSAGKARKGVIHALTEKEARDKLREQQLLVSWLHLKKKGTAADLKGKNLLAFTMQLSQLLNAGLPLYESLIALEEQYRGEPSHTVLTSLREKVKGGAPFSQALSAHPASFDALYCALIAAGESTGSLPSACLQLTTLLDRQLKLKKQLVTALIYPTLLGGFAFVVLTLLLTFVLPSIEALFEGRSLNGFTAMVMGASHLLRRYWLLLLLLAGGGIAWLRWKLHSPLGKQRLYAWCLKLPLLRSAMIHTAIARLTRTMGTLQQGGVPLVEALKIARNVMNSPAFEPLIDRAQKHVIEGSSLSVELAGHPLIPPLVSRMLAIGEETGDSAGMFHKIADIYEEEVEKTLSRLTALAQPVILLVMGAIVGLVMLAILLPLTDISAIGFIFKFGGSF